MRTTKKRNLLQEESINLETTSATSLERKVTVIELASKTTAKTDITAVAGTSKTSVTWTTCTQCTTTKWWDCTTDSSTPTMLLPCKTHTSTKIDLKTFLLIATSHSSEEIPTLANFTAKTSPQPKPDSLKWDFSLDKCSSKAYSTIFLRNKECSPTPIQMSTLTSILTITEGSDFIVA